MNILTIAGVCILKDGKLLLLKQSEAKKDGQAGGWGPPAGHGEEGEKLSETAMRETKEECNLNVKLTGVIESGLYKISDGRTYLIVIYKGETNNWDNLRIDNNEVVDFKLVGLKEIKNDLFKLRHPLLKSILIKSLENKPHPLETFKEIEIRV